MPRLRAVRTFIRRGTLSAETLSVATSIFEATGVPIGVGWAGGAATGAVAPVPLSATVFGLPAGMPTVSVAERVPTAEGVKPTVIVHVPAAGTDAHVLAVIAKSAELAPPMLAVVTGIAT